MATQSNAFFSFAFKSLYLPFERNEFSDALRLPVLVQNVEDYVVASVLYEIGRSCRLGERLVVVSCDSVDVRLFGEISAGVLHCFDYHCEAV